MAVKDYSTTSSENASVGSVNFAEGQAANTVNNSNREVMKDVKDGTIVTVINHAAMTALTKAKQADDAVVECLGETTVGDGLGGLFYWDSASTDTADAETILAANEGGTGRWIKIRGTYKGNKVIVSDATGTTEGEVTGIYNKKTLVYRVTNLPENATRQWFKFTLGTADNISAMVRVEAALRMPGQIKGGASVGWYHIGQASDVGGPLAETMQIQSSGFCALALPVVSGDDIIFGGFVADNSTATTTSRVDLFITLYYGSTESDFTFTGLDGTTAHTGAASETRVVVDTGFAPAQDNVNNLGTAALRWKEVFAGLGTINTSDLRLKDEIADPVPLVLDAWESVPLKTFKMKDAIASKGRENARLHAGVVAQDIEAAFVAKGLDAGDYGLFVKDKGADGSDLLLIRPTECLFMEAAALRRKLADLESRIVTLGG